MVDLGTLGGSSAVATWVNDNGDVAGYSTTTGDQSTGSDDAFLWTQAGGMQDLGSLGGDTEATMVNNGDQVVGFSYTGTAFNGAIHAFSWTTSGGMQDLGTLGGTNSEAFAVTDAGEVTGISDTASGTQHAFVWTEANGMQDLGTLGETSSPAGLNANGDVAGYSALDGSNEHAFLWTASSGMTDLGTLNGSHNSIATAVNGGDQVAGYSGDGAVHAFSWTAAGGMVDLGTLGGTYSQPAPSAQSVNDAGAIVGYSGTTGNQAEHPFLWTSGGGMQDLGTLGGDFAQAVGVNKNGTVIGYSHLAGNDPGVVHAFAWAAAGGMQDLGTVSGGTQSYPSSVNAGGEIAGLATDAGGSSHAILWEPSAATAPPGIHVVGAQILDSSNNPLILRGVDYSGPEYMCVQGNPTPTTVGRGIFEGPTNTPTPPAALAAWGINAVRLPLNEDCWLGINGVDPQYGGASYRTAITNYVNQLVAAGIVPILDLSGTAPGTSLAGFRATAHAGRRSQPRLLD